MPPHFIKSAPIPQGESPDKAETGLPQASPAEGVVERVGAAMMRVDRDLQNHRTDDEIRTLARAAIEAMQGGWQPIETCPRGLPGFLACNAEEYDCIEWLICHSWDDKEHRFLNQNSGNYSRSNYWTHWHPLPSAPAALSEKGA